MSPLLRGLVLFAPTTPEPSRLLARLKEVEAALRRRETTRWSVAERRDAALRQIALQCIVQRVTALAPAAVALAVRAEARAGDTILLAALVDDAGLMDDPPVRAAFAALDVLRAVVLDAQDRAGDPPRHHAGVATRRAYDAKIRQWYAQLQPAANARALELLEACA